VLWRLGKGCGVAPLWQGTPNDGKARYPRRFMAGDSSIQAKIYDRH
jgi:hypothetical protein